MDILSQDVLVLNKSWVKIGVVDVQKAIVMLFTIYKSGEPKAKIIDPVTYIAHKWEDWVKFEASHYIRSGTISFPVPEIIILTRYEKTPKPVLRFSRQTLFKRDNKQCQYCFETLPANGYTVDHVIPRSLGGKTTWENCVVACGRCNMKKANKTPKQANMELKITPIKPKNQFFQIDVSKAKDSWKNFI